MALIYCRRLLSLQPDRVILVRLRLRLGPQRLHLFLSPHPPAHSPLAPTCRPIITSLCSVLNCLLFRPFSCLRHQNSIPPHHYSPFYQLTLFFKTCGISCHSLFVFNCLHAPEEGLHVFGLFVQLLPQCLVTGIFHFANS